MSASNSRDLLRKRLNSYWQLELANVVLLPLLLVFITVQLDSTLGWLSWFAMVPMCGLLLVGGLYWRGKLLQVERKSASALCRTLALATGLRRLLLGLCVIAVGLAGASGFVSALSVSLADRIVASFAAILAALEYVNYYHRQLQHFDHKPDLERLRAGRGWGRSQMSVDLERYRRGTL